MLTTVRSQSHFATGSLDFLEVPAPTPPEVSFHFIDLPQTTLHYLKCGDGPPLIMVPATISRIQNWLHLAQFMGQKFTTYFFELPGHGGSTPFSQPFTTELVAETVEDFIDSLGYQRVSLMGFSFGGILAMKSLYRLGDRVDRVILLAPAITNRALSFSGAHRRLIRCLVRVMHNRHFRAGFLSLIHNPRAVPILAAALRRLGKVEKSIPMDQVFRKINPSTCEVMSYQMAELLDLELPHPPTPFRQPCFFAMSVNDTMLDFDTTLEIVEGQFRRVVVERFDYPYHQPPEPPTFGTLVEEYGRFLDCLT